MTIRILHLVTSHEPDLPGDDAGRPAVAPGFRSGCDSVALACRRAIELTTGIEHHVLAVGGSRVARRLAALGVPVHDRLSPACRSAWIGRNGLLRYAHSRPPFDAVQPWCDLTRRMIPPCLPSRIPPSIEQLCRLLATFRGGVIAPDTEVLRRLAAGSRRLPVVLFAADPPEAGDAGALFRVIGLADKSGERFALVIPAGVRGVHRVARLHGLLHLKCPIMITDRSAAEWIDAADIVLTVAVKDPRDVLIGTFAAARGVPVVTSPDGPMTLMEYYAPAARALRAYLARPGPQPAEPTYDDSVSAWLVDHWLGTHATPATAARA